jgi:MOSC domain-containing protein YiiM
MDHAPGSDAGSSTWGEGAVSYRDLFKNRNRWLNCYKRRTAARQDHYRIGSARFEVTQPRVMCYRVLILMNEPRMPALLTSSGRPGFYLRVLQAGEVGAGDDIVKEAEANERMTIAETSHEQVQNRYRR